MVVRSVQLEGATLMSTRDREPVAGTEMLEQKLDILIRLVALQLARNEETLGDRALLLRRAGLGLKEIAQICGTTLKSVSVRLAEARRREPRHKPRR